MWGRSIAVRRLVSTALAVVFMLGAAAAAQAQTLERVRASGTFKIGYRVDAEPYAYKNTLGEPAGYSVDLCRAVAASVKAKLGLAGLIGMAVVMFGRFLKRKWKNPWRGSRYVYCSESVILAMKASPGYEGLDLDSDEDPQDLLNWFVKQEGYMLPDTEP